MSETQVLLSKIAALRQRLEQAQGLAREAGSAAASLTTVPSGRLSRLEHQVRIGADDSTLLDCSLRQLTDGAGGQAKTERTGPTQLTARARRLLETGRQHVLRLRGLDEEFALADLLERAPDDPLGMLYRQSAAATGLALRMVQAFPDAPSVQLRLCEGLEAVLTQVGRQVEKLGILAARRKDEEDRVTFLAGLLADLNAGRSVEVRPFVDLAEALLAETQQSAPLRFLHASPAEPARFVACHSLTVAQVMARLVHHDPDLRTRPMEPVLAALVHDAGMLTVPVEVLTHAGPLVDESRRLVEGHCRAGAELAGRLLPGSTWLAEAAASHHERLDGTGYPDGQHAGRLTPLLRLLAVCDVYAALCTPRPHRPAREPRTALADTLLLAEQGGLDRYQAERLLHLSFYPVGTAVELAGGEVGVVAGVHHDLRDLQAPARPLLLLLTDAQGRPRPLPQALDLAECEGRSIARTLPEDERRALLGPRYPEWA